MSATVIKLMVLLFAALAGSAFAQPDPRFSYESAAESFEAAALPTDIELAGKWLQIGKVSAPQMDHYQDGYWPDGNVKIRDHGGHFQNFATLVESTDALGNKAFSETATLIGSESGRVYDTEGPFTGVLTATGFRFDVRADDVRFNQYVECRILRAEGMLICKNSIIHRSESAYTALTKD